ncbi:hypothetical protein [Celeribacter neptunius]|uniref:Uncharacterized protein n=1 Tax=Celeribacter neptunius TaxID=588602 RepID=A0A1I3N5Z8_9RHOB|nr:hypothetical protein [Celeribacter neptunius]SFJ04734.1 hypothetical protein SAMN04487991_1273 [Celeribacter neptunius]
MKLFGTFYLVNAFYLLVASIAHASDPADLGGFILGSSLEEAQSHARTQEWTLAPISENLPGSWTVEGTNLSLFICNGTVKSIKEKLEGDFEEFTALVFSMQLELGQPEIKILSLPSGVGVISTIDVRFEMAGGGASVQLQSIGGNRTFSTNRWIESECP